MFSRIFGNSKPTVTGKKNFGNSEVEESARSFNQAMQGVGTDEKRIIKEIIGHTNAQRQLIKERYKVMYGQTLEHDLKSELSGDFEDVVVALLQPSIDFDANCLKNAISGLGTDERAVIDILCSRDAKEINELKEAYQRLYHKNLENELKFEERGPVGNIFRSLATGDRPSGNNVDTALAQEEAQQLYNAGEGQTGTDEDVFVRVLCSRSYAQLRATFNEYSKISGGRDIEQSVKRETSGELDDALLAIVKCVRNEPAYFAERLHDSMKGLGTNEKEIIRLMVSRCEIDMVDIRHEYRRLYDRDLASDVKGELKGDFEDILVALIGKN